MSNAQTSNNQVTGQLSKFTNALRGYQFRYFILNPSKGTLEYYLPQDHKRNHPRGVIILSGSIITPNEDDGLTFNVCSSSGEIYKLRAADSKERQFWVDQLRQVSNSHHLRRNDPNNLELSADSSLQAVRELVIASRRDLNQLETSIDSYSPSGNHDLLKIKAFSQASLSAIQQCYEILNSA